jgi:predicted ArsR family transcriptional regulator
MSTLLGIHAGDRLKTVIESERDRNLRALSLLDEPVRRRLFDWVLDQNRPVGREEASLALHISRPLATFHLDKLADVGLLESDYQRLSGRTGPGAGRPARVYWRSQREFNVNVPERNYERAAELFATALEAHTGGLPTPLREAAGELGKNLGAREHARSSTRRLMDALQDGGYEPQVDESGAIRLLNCPFHALVGEHRPLVCGTNMALAEGITRGARVTDMVPVLDSQPGYCCVSFRPSHESGARSA